MREIGKVEITRLRSSPPGVREAVSVERVPLALSFRPRPWAVKLLALPGRGGPVVVDWLNYSGRTIRVIGTRTRTRRYRRTLWWNRCWAGFPLSIRMAKRMLHAMGFSGRTVDGWLPEDDETRDRSDPRAIRPGTHCVTETIGGGISRIPRPPETALRVAFSGRPLQLGLRLEGGRPVEIVYFVRIGETARVLDGAAPTGTGDLFRLREQTIRPWWWAMHEGVPNMARVPLAYLEGEAARLGFNPGTVRQLAAILHS